MAHARLEQVGSDGTTQVPSRPFGTPTSDVAQTNLVIFRSGNSRYLTYVPPPVRTSLRPPESNRSICRIRSAVRQDSQRIAQIAMAVAARNLNDLSYGFLIYPLAAEEYGRRIADKQFVYMFLVQDSIVGFICGYNRDALVRYSRSTVLAHESVVIETILEFADSHGDPDFVFLDSIALLPTFQNRGFGEQAFAQFCSLVQRSFYVAMLEKPIRNPRIAYWSRRGFVRIGEARQPVSPRFALPHSRVTTPRDLLKWGIYALQSQSFKPQRPRVSNCTVVHQVPG